MGKKKRANKKGLFQKGIRWIAYLSGGKSFADAADSVMRNGLVSSMLGNDAVPQAQGGMRAVDGANRMSSKDSDYELFAEHQYDRNLAKIYMLLCGICVMLFIMFMLYGAPLFGALSVTLFVFLAVYLFASVKIFSRDYELKEINGIDVIVPGPLFHFSLMGGRANDVFIDYENKMRTCLLQCRGLPEKMNDATTHFECVSFDDDYIVFRFYFADVLGAYEFLKQNANRFAVEFGDPNGAELTKVRDGVFELVFDQMKTDFNSRANVRWE